MSIAFHQAAKNFAGIIFRFGIFIGLWALSTLLTCRGGLSRLALTPFRLVDPDAFLSVNA
jgi:hypothetical protein